MSGSREQILDTVTSPLDGVVCTVLVPVLRGLRRHARTEPDFFVAWVEQTLATPGY